MSRRATRASAGPTAAQSPESRSLAGRYASWLERRAGWSRWRASSCSRDRSSWSRHDCGLFADFSYLLPQDAPAVRDLRRLEERLAAKDTVLVVVVAPDAATRAAAAAQVAASVRTIDHALVERVETDDKVTRDFLRAHRHLLVPLPDLIEARDALRERIKRAKLKANPLYIDLDDDAQAADRCGRQARGGPARPVA